MGLTTYTIRTCDFCEKELKEATPITVSGDTVIAFNDRERMFFNGDEMFCSLICFSQFIARWLKANKIFNIPM